MSTSPPLHSQHCTPLAKVVFVSADHDDSSFREYCGEMPWLAVPWAAPQRLSTPQRFQVNGIPHLKVNGKSRAAGSRVASPFL